MAFRNILVILALGLLMTSGCHSSSSYRAPCQQPAVVATTPVAAPCATAVPPPPAVVLPPR